MNRKFWENTWDILDIGFDQSHYNSSLETFFPRHSLPEKSAVFVPLCGKSIDMLWLKNRKVKVIGVEWCRKACEMFFATHGIPYSVTPKENFKIFESEDITLLCGDFFDLKQNDLEPFTFVYDRAALIALPKETRKKYVEHLHALIQFPIQVMLITVCYDQNTMEGPPFSVCEKEVYSLYQKNFTIQCVKTEDLRPIAPHLQAKGLKSAKSQVFFLESIKHLTGE